MISETEKKGLYWFKNANIKDIVEHISKISRQSYYESLARAKKRGDLETVMKLECAIKHLQSLKTKKYDGSNENSYYRKIHYSIFARVGKKAKYADCTVDDRFIDFDYFYKWCLEQDGYNCLDDKGCPFEIDKDILVPGNKVYGPDTCCFVPNEMNGFLNFNKSTKNTGTYYTKSGRFAVQCHGFDGKIYRGTYDTQEEANLQYRICKESFAKILSLKWKNSISEQVFNQFYDFSVDKYLDLV